ncbi:MAG: dihydrolipoyl dehydrogenase [Methanocella sp.]
MEKFDTIVIGSGGGILVVFEAVNKGIKVALVDHGPLGGSCPNNACIPSKILITPADAIRTFQDARAIGVNGTIDGVDFGLIMERMRYYVNRGRKELEEYIMHADNLMWYKETGAFTGDYTLKVGDETITAPRIALASGSRPAIPPIPGLTEAGFLDSITVLDLDKPPESLIMIGGGYIGCEYGHFFSAINTDVTLLGMAPVLMKHEDPEFSSIITKALSRYMKVHTSHAVNRVAVEDGKKAVYARDLTDGKEYRYEADEIFLASGRRSNADMLKAENTGVETDKRGWIKVNDRLETSKPGIYAMGDATGRYMFRHTVNYEARIVAANMLNGDSQVFDTHAVPHAVYVHPQVAGVGLLESEVVTAGHNILVGRARYMDVPKGYALAEEDGLVKIIVDADTKKILGCSVAGSESAALVQQIVYLMNTNSQDITPMLRSQVMHPSVNEVMAKALSNLKSPKAAAESYGMAEAPT